MSDVPARFWVPGMVIALLATLYIAHQIVQPQAAPVADAKLERINQAKAELLRASRKMKECYDKYADVDCFDRYVEVFKQVAALDCAYVNYTRGNSELEKIHRRWRQDTEDAIRATVYKGNLPLFGDVRNCADGQS